MDQVRETLTALINNRYIGAAFIISLSFVSAAIVDFIVARLCRRLTRRTASTIDDRIIDLLHQPVRTTVFLIGLWLAAVRLALPPRPETIVTAGIKTLVIIVWMVFAIRFVSIILANLSRSTAVNVVEPRTRPLFDNLARILLFTATIYLIFVFWGIDVTAWLASAGIIGIAVGFAAKDTLANLFSGIFILADAPYKVGDFVNLDTGERGEVRHIGLRSTRLLTRDDVEITIPNAVIANAKIVNESGGPWAKERIRVRVSVAYGSDVDRLRDVLTEIGREHPQTCDDPEPRVRFRTFGDSSLDFELLCWIDEPVLRGQVLDALNSAIYKRLASEGIEIPYPKRDVYIRHMPPGTNLPT
ncbi:MAG: mechanosensitive ion channel family protein [Candidatus Krumholzibacteria bacterium]|nr:mechanosensitive ion channel family protein [Candidatus Krumholzibacteria bacterium]